MTTQLENQRSKIGRQKIELTKLQNMSSQQTVIIDSLEKQVRSNQSNIVTNSTELGTRIETAEANATSAISNLGSNVETNKNYWLYGTLGTLLLGGFIYWFLGRRISTSKTDVETQIKNTKKSLEEESIKLDSKLVEVLETQLKLKEEELKVQASAGGRDVDHSLALKVADEIIRIRKNLGRMDDKTKGLKQLNASVKRIQNNFAANGYELVDMLGKEYNEGMKAIVNFVESEDIETGKQVITRVIKPQVNFSGKMVQSAQIEVSTGE